jgi:hypothetical protein
MESGQRPFLVYSASTTVTRYFGELEAMIREGAQKTSETESNGLSEDHRSEIHTLHNEQ